MVRGLHVFDDTKSMNFVATFLELWLIMTFLELRLGMEGEHVAISGCGLVNWYRCECASYDSYGWSPLDWAITGCSH